jgi:hypothetical protein
MTFDYNSLGAMGWRQRDWAKFSDAEREAFFSGAATPVASRRTSRGGRGVVLGLLVVLAVGAAAVWVHQSGLYGNTTKVNLPSIPTNSAGIPPIIFGRVPSVQPGVVALIRWRPQDLAPATARGQICVNVERSFQGQFCTMFVAGQRPADVLTRTIESHGVAVHSVE